MATPWAAIASAVAQGIGGSVSAYGAAQGYKSAGVASKEEGQLRAYIAMQRAKMAKQHKKEQMDYSIGVAEKHAAWEVDVNLEKSKYMVERMQEEATLVKSSQTAGYASAGISRGSGSSMAVMKRSADNARREQSSVMRGHELFAEKTGMELESFRESQQKSYDWFVDDLKAETKYEVRSSLAGGRAAESQASKGETSSYVSMGASILGIG